MAQRFGLTTEELAVRTHGRAQRALGATDVGDLFAQYRAVIGPPADELSDLARSALEDLRNGITPGAEALQALEYAIRLMRPAPLVRRGVIDPLEPEAVAAFPGWDTFQEAVKPYLSAVARIDRAEQRGLVAQPVVGTGFLVGPTSLVTNRHVVDELTLGTSRLGPGQAVARFGQEYKETPDPAAVPVAEVAAVHPDLDLAVLRLERPPDDSFPTPASPFPLAPVAVEDGAGVAAIGYPVEDARNPSFVKLVFNDRYKVKRVAVGEVTGSGRGVLFHDCTTLGGNSGSPVLTLDGAQLVGVHFTGFYLARNEALTGEPVLEFLGPFAGGG
ncbi:MAG: serine protease [Acidimicrobiales bacterium]